MKNLDIHTPSQTFPLFVRVIVPFSTIQKSLGKPHARLKCNSTYDFLLYAVLMQEQYKATIKD